MKGSDSLKVSREGRKKERKIEINKDKKKETEKHKIEG